MKNKTIKEVVIKNYAKIVKKGSSCCIGQKSPHAGDDIASTISKSVGYSQDEIKGVPEGANLGLGCGNPVALASLKEGDVVVDLGSGAGFDSFLAANRVGRKGMVIGIDITPEMVEKARQNAKKGHYENVKFKLGEIENIPLANSVADVVLSNCVINLSRDKKKVFQEAFRVLKPGGRLMVSDIVLLKNLPDAVKNSIEAYVGCLAGAVRKEEYIQAVKDAGFEAVGIMSESHFPIEWMSHDSMAKAVIDNLKISPGKLQEIGKLVVSIKVSAVKPGPLATPDFS